jgi:hypothetical protein
MKILSSKPTLLLVLAFASALVAVGNPSQVLARAYSTNVIKPPPAYHYSGNFYGSVAAGSNVTLRGINYYNTLTLSNLTFDLIDAQLPGSVPPIVSSSSNSTVPEPGAVSLIAISSGLMLLQRRLRKRTA